MRERWKRLTFRSILHHQQRIALLGQWARNNHLAWMLWKRRAQVNEILDLIVLVASASAGASANASACVRDDVQ